MTSLAVWRERVPWGGSAFSSTAPPASSTPAFGDISPLKLSNVANLPITIYPGMKIGQISLFKMTSPAEKPLRLGQAQEQIRRPGWSYSLPLLGELHRGVAST